MNLKAIFVTAAIAAMPTLAGTAAQADVINISGSAAPNGGPSYYEINFDFALPIGFSNAVLNITQLRADDRGVLKLNGAIVDSAAIICCGAPAFDFNDGNGSVPFAYPIGNGARNIFINSGFLNGTNALRLLMNDTSAGQAGNLLNGPAGPAFTTDYNFAATVTYDAPIGPGPVPEPATWALMIGGFGMAGAMLRRRRAVAA